MEDLTQDIIPPIEEVETIPIQTSEETEPLSSPDYTHFIEEVPSQPSEEMEPLSSPNYTPFIEEVPSKPSEEMETPLLDWSPDNTPTIEEV